PPLFFPLPDSILSPLSLLHFSLSFSFHLPLNLSLLLLNFSLSHTHTHTHIHTHTHAHFDCLFVPVSRIFFIPRSLCSYTHTQLLCQRGTGDVVKCLSDSILALYFKGSGFTHRDLPHVIINSIYVSWTHREVALE